MPITTNLTAMVQFVIGRGRAVDEAAGGGEPLRCQARRRPSGGLPTDKHHLKQDWFYDRMHLHDDGRAYAMVLRNDGEIPWGLAFGTVMPAVRTIVIGMKGAS